MTNHQTPHLTEALARWKEQIGTPHVLDDETTLTRYAQCGIPQTIRPSAVLLPASVEEIQAVLETANQFKIPLYPISRGKNLGYGTASPVTQNNVIVDLGRMNRILEVDKKLAYAVVEPGVTQQQMYEYLKTNHIPLCLDTTGASPEASLIGNILERGYGQNAYSDHFLNSCGMEVVLANGEILKTGFGRYPNAKTTYLYKWGIGPSLDGLFTQSNFGIVTKIGVWLAPKPERFGIFHFQIADEQQLGETVERLRELKMRGALPGALHIYDDIRVISALQQYPWTESNGVTPLSEEIRAQLRKRHGVGRWNCAGSLLGSRKQIHSDLHSIRRHLRGITRVHFVSDGLLAFAARFQGLYKKITGIDISRRLFFTGLLRGVPTEQPLLACYWRKRKPAPAQNFRPLQDGCGLIWCSPIIPMTREDCFSFLQMTRTALSQSGFETNISMNLVTERALDCVVGIFYDKENAEETQKAEACYQNLLASYLENGYIPYRIGVQSMEKILLGDTFDAVCRNIKQALDPAHILAPGRYQSLPI